MMKFSDVAKIVTGSTPSTKDPENYGVFIPFVKPPDLNGSVINETESYLSERGSRLARIIPKNSVLVGCIGSLGKVAIAGRELATNQQINALVFNEKLVHPRYGFHFCKTIGPLLKSMAPATTVPLVNKSRFSTIEMPVPALDEQRRIAAILDKADEIKASSIQIQDSRIRIIQSAFVEMFGDPIINPNNYPKILFGELGTLDRGKSKHRPRNDPRLLGGNHPLIQTGEIRSADLFVDTFTSTYSDFGLAQSRKWPEGTLAITIAANIAESAILGIEACFPDSIVGFTPNSVSNSVFIKAQLDFLKDRISEVAPQSAQKNINLKILREIPMICPPVEMQEQFEDFVRNATLIFDSANKGIDMAEELSQSSVQSLIN